MNQWQVGTVKITRIVEMEVTGGTLFILPDATRDACLPIEWLGPHFMGHSGQSDHEYSRTYRRYGRTTNHRGHLCR